MNMKLTLLFLTIALGTGFTGCAAPAEKSPCTTQPAISSVPVNKFCPVDPKSPIDPKVTYVYNGKTYGFCCEDCIKEFKKDPAKYAAEAK
jgi:YHS domain-containing protein